MFGLTKREQLWAAQERGLQIILDAGTARTLLALEQIKKENLKIEFEMLKLRQSKQAF
jgi:hypothetical protein